MDVDAGMLLALESWRHAGSDPERRVDVFVTRPGDPAPLVSAGLALGHHDGEVATGSLRLADLPAVAAVDGVRWIALSAPVHLHLDKSIKEIRADQVRSNAPPYAVGATAGLTGKGVLVGAIDDMVMEFHPSFARPNTTPPQTRFAGIWNQLPRPVGGQTSPPGFPYGVLWDETAINGVLKSKDYAALKMTSRYDHGSHVTGIAAGNGWRPDGRFPAYTFVGVAPEADLAFCNGAALVSARAASDGLKWIFGLATARDQPCVVNMSFGTHEGARDGSSELERAIDRALHGPDGQPLPGRAVVVAAGNEADMRRHGRKTLAAGGTESFRFDIEKITFPNGLSISEDLSDDKFYLWYDGAASIELRILPPRSTFSDWLKPGQSQTIAIRGTTVATTASAAQPDPFNGKKRIEVALPGPVRLGRWTVQIREVANQPATVDLWVDRIGDSDLWPQIVPGDNVVANTVTSPNTARGVISVGAYVSELGQSEYAETYGELAPSSSWGLDGTDGATTDQIRPHLTAPGRRIISANRSTRVDEKQSYVQRRYGTGWTLADHVVMSGTSQAAPHVTGVVALMFQRNPTLTYRQVRDILAATATRGQIPAGETLPNLSWGYGKLDAAAALAATPAQP